MDICLCIFALIVSFCHYRLLTSSSVTAKTQKNNDKEVVVHLNLKSVGPLKILSFCDGCDDPADEGSFVFALGPKHILIEQTQSTTGKLVYTVPNLANSNRIYNSEALKGNIALVDRGEVPIMEKCIRLQNLGVIGIIVGDDGQCVEDFSTCGPGAGGVATGGFSPYDDPLSWANIRIPVYLISLESTKRLRSLMDLEMINVPTLGYQYIPMTVNNQGIRREL